MKVTRVVVKPYVVEPMARLTRRTQPTSKVSDAKPATAYSATTTFADGAGQSFATSGCGALAPRLGLLPGRFWAGGSSGRASGAGSTLGARSHAVAAIERLMAAASSPVAR